MQCPSSTPALSLLAFGRVRVLEPVSPPERLSVRSFRVRGARVRVNNAIQGKMKKKDGSGTEIGTGRGTREVINGVKVC